MPISFKRQTTHHIALVGLHRNICLDAAIHLVSRKNQKSTLTESVLSDRPYSLNCLMTMFDNILRLEVTTAAQVSSAEHSRPRIVNSFWPGEFVVNLAWRVWTPPRALNPHRRGVESLQTAPSVGLNM